MFTKEEIQATLQGIQEGDHALTEGARRVLLEIVDRADHTLIFVLYATLAAILEKDADDLDFISRNN